LLAVAALVQRNLILQQTTAILAVVILAIATLALLLCKDILTCNLAGMILIAFAIAAPLDGAHVSQKLA